MSDHERIAQVAHQKWVNRLFFRANRTFAHFFTKSEHFAQKMDEQIPSPVYSSWDSNLWGFCQNQYCGSFLPNFSILWIRILLNMDPQHCNQLNITVLGSRSRQNFMGSRSQNKLPAYRLWELQTCNSVHFSARLLHFLPPERIINYSIEAPVRYICIY